MLRDQDSSLPRRARRESVLSFHISVLVIIAFKDGRIDEVSSGFEELGVRPTVRAFCLTHLINI